MEFLILGPLEARIGQTSLPLGGAKQRAVLAALLLRAGEVVPVERLVDEVWGDDPPATAARNLESYVSRLRALFNGSGPSLVRRGSGYVFELGTATLDSHVFVELLDQACAAADMWEYERATDLARVALSTWRGPARADVVLSSTGRAEAERLEEQRLRACEVRFGAELELGRHSAIVGELQAAIGQSPYREKFVEQLMVALYRSGRHAEALDAYEQLRRRLDDDLGLQPSLELQQLSGRIVRQDSALRRPATTPSVTRRATRSRASRRVSLLVVGGLAAAAVMSLTASGGTGPTGPVEADPGIFGKRIALVVPRSPVGANTTDPAVYYSSLGFRNTAAAWGHEMQTFAIDARDSEQRAREVVDGNFDLVVVAGDGPGARALGPLVDEASSTRFAFVGARLGDLGLADASNAAGYPFAEQESAQLAGYLSALVAPRHARGRQATDLVSIVTGPPTPSLERMAEGFAKGARRAAPSVRVRVDYVLDPSDRSACEAVANRQIDAGSDVVFAVGSACGSGALAVVRVRGVWGIRAEDEYIQNGPHILGTVSKYWEGAVARPITELGLGSFPAGTDTELGLADEYSVLFLAEEARVSESLWSRVVRYCSSIRRQTTTDT